VIVRNFGSPGCDVYVKGAPECMKDICRAESCEIITNEFYFMSLFTNPSDSPH
jgi:hypothetical protein